MEGSNRMDGRTALICRRVFSYLLLALSVVLALMPFYMLLINSSRYHVEIQKGFSFLPGSALDYNVMNLLEDDNLPILNSIRNSFIIAAGASVLSVYFSALTAYGIFAYEFKVKKAALTFILMIMMVPTQVSALGFIDFMTKMKLTNSFIPLIVPAIAAPAVFFFMRQYMENSLPLEIVEAARIDGGHEFYNFNRIVLPILKPAIAVQIIFSFVTAWNNYFMPALLLDSKDKKTLPLLVAQLRSASFDNFDMGKVYALLAIAIVPIIIVYLFLSKYIIRGVALGSVKG